MNLHLVILPIPFEPVPKIYITDEKYILSVCRFSADKMSILPLIDGFATAYSKGLIDPAYRLKIVGDGELHNTVAQAVENANHTIGAAQIQLLGTVTGIALFELYAKCTLYVGMGTTILQCAQYSKPIVKVGIEPHTMPYAWGLWGETPGDENKLYAYNEPIENKSSFEQIIIKILADTSMRESSGKKAKKIIAEVYDIDTILQQWNGAYSTLAAAPQICKKTSYLKTVVYNATMRLIYSTYRLVRK